ncbi:MAG TPA: substrate-binding domain-containing protein [Nitrospiraceae bacterium]|nr:substrate-binding domain-containing protein [Nitrospiraceae bacterium]
MNMRWRTRRGFLALSGAATLAFLALSFVTWISPVEAGLTGRILIAGYGPELPIFQDLAKLFEKAHPGTAVEFEWDRNVKAVELVRAGIADLAVIDRPVPGLRDTRIAWDGIAVIVNFANPIREVSSAQLRDLFTGRVTRWSDMDGSSAKVQVFDRAPEDNVKAGFETSLGIAGQTVTPAAVVRTDQKALRAVSGNTAAITYLSLAAALKAQEDGIPIQVLTVDKVEPGQPTVKDGSYPLRRPLYLLSREQPSAIAEAFIAFALSAEAEPVLRTAFVPSGRPATSREAKVPGLPGDIPRTPRDTES